MKIIILILFCIIGFLCGWWAREVSKGIITPINIECDGGICPPIEEYEKEGGE